MAKMFVPYNLAMELDYYFTSTPEGALAHEDFFNLVEALQAVGSEKSQTRTANLFKTLPKEEVIRRARLVVRLDKLLKTIKSNNDISRSSTP